MKYPGLQVLLAYRTALNGQITYDGQTVPVFTRPVVDEVTAPYIYLSDVNVANDVSVTDKDSYGYLASILITVYTEFPDKMKGSQQPMMEITEDIIEIVGERIPIASIFYNIEPNIDSIIPAEEVTPECVIMKNFIRMSNYIKEL